MNVTITQVDREQVLAQLRALRTRRHRDVDREYDEVLQRLEQIGDATGLLDVADALRRGGFDAEGRPKLALARADRKRVRLSRRRGSVMFDANGPAYRGGPTLTLPQFIERFELPGTKDGHQAFARVPLVPPAIRDETKGPLSRYHIMWQVDEWIEEPQPRADRDPILLKRIGKTGTLFAVIAQWDLTPLEQAILNSIQVEVGR